MGATLDKLIELRVSSLIENHSKDTQLPPGDIEYMHDSLSEQLHAQIHKEICQDITQEELDKLRHSAETQHKSEARKKAVDSVTSLLLESLILSGVIGLVVNQVTDLLTYAKSLFSSLWAVGITFAIVIILLIAVVLFFFLRLSNIIKTLLEDS